MARSATGPVIGVAAGLVVGAVAVGALAASGWPGRQQVDATLEQPGAARAFLTAWERSRTGTWALEGTFQRVQGGRAVLTTAVHAAQRPPDRLRIGLGSVDAVEGGRRLACAPDAEGVVACRDGGPAPPYREEVRSELSVLRTYVTGAGRLYGVVADDGGCFTLRLRGAYLTPPYGQRARFCFDGATGAPVRSEIERLEATDRTVAVSVRARVSDADLEPMGGEGEGRG
jgi:hypothetical protein